MKRKTVVIDTNVLHVANNNAEQAGPTCVLNVIGRLEKVRTSNRTALDDSGFILQEYLDQRFQFSGQPGVGDAFFKWLFENQTNEAVCEVVSVTPLDEEGKEFEEFPDDPALDDFDRSDRKFVAVALASSNAPPILNAVDSDWWNFREALAANRIQVDFMCPDQFGG